MKNKMYKTEFNIKEFINLFKKKKCKFCGSKLKKFNSYNGAGYGKDGLMRVKFKVEIIKVDFKYKCERCNMEYGLMDI